MINAIERQAAKLFANADASKIIEMYNGMVSDQRAAMIEAGWEEVVAQDGVFAVGDGDDFRPVIRVGDKAYALRPELHAQWLAEAIEQARQRDAALAAKKEQEANATTQATTCTTLIDDQLCGGTLVRAAVCPRCALGKQGVEATLTCDVCGHVTAIIRGGING